ncbi:MAG: hypothetical protein J6T47_02310 [Lachnospiraceae bacterium]|nr:hypothetical protein [Lachnospiraceae bacterium]
MDLKALQELLAGSGLYVYEKSADQAEDTCIIMVRNGLEKCLAVAGKKSDLFTGKEDNGIRFCPLNNENAAALQQLFPYTKPASHKGHRFTMGFGDRLGLATAGHVRAIAGHDIYPVFAQQSIRELTLTHRTFADIIAAAAFNVFQEGYKGGYGADGDHLKTKEEIKYALESGCTMVTLDCSEHIDQAAAAYSDEKISEMYAALPQALRTHYEKAYLNRELPIVKSLSEAELKRIVVVFHDAVTHAVDCYHYIDEIKTVEVDFELSIDETLTITTPAEHFVIGSELHAAGIVPISVAPHFSGAFEKGIEYSGNLNDFARDFVVHQEIADFFGYKLSLHSGSDKFAVFSTVARVSKGHIHVKTAGTSWLEAMRVVAEVNPDLYRRAHKFSIEHRSEAEKYYHVSTKVDSIPNIDLQNDAYLPIYMTQEAARQTVHIAYGLLLEQDWFREEFFRTMAEYEENYYDALLKHLGRHIEILTAELGM